MSKEERYLKKIGKLLTLYGVSEKEKSNFLADIQDAKYDDPDDEEEKVKTEETSTEQETTADGEEKVENEEKVETETKSGDEEESTKTESEEVKSQEGEEETKTTGEEETTESDQEVPPTLEGEENQEQEGSEEETIEFNPESEIKELKKANEGLSARLSALEEIVKEFGVEETDEEDQTIGASPSGNAIDETQESAFDRINRKRIGY